MAYNRKDFYFKEAKRLHFAARSVFKLEEIDERFKILKAGMHVLDLGAAPGSWSQYTSRRVGPGGRILGIDLKAIELTLPNAVFIKDDFTTLDWQTFNPPFDVVLSDMAPNTTGIRFTDQVRSFELCEKAWACAQEVLKPKGHFVCKLFEGEDIQMLVKALRQRFQKVEILRPKSTRKESKETFLIGISYAPAPIRSAAPSPTHRSLQAPGEI